MRIRGKVVAIVMTAAASALLLAGGVLLAAERERARRDLIADLAALSSIVADNSSAALAFSDPGTAIEVLRALRAKPHVVAGCIYDVKGRIFASVTRRGRLGSCPAAPHGSGNRIAGRTIEHWQPVLIGMQPGGELLLRSDLAFLDRQLRVQMATMALALLIAGAAALLLSLRLQRVVSQPVQELLGIAGAVRQHGDYRLRAVRQSDDEVGELVDSFNLMLEQIQRRDAELQLAKEALEIRVEERTRELAQRNRELQASNRELDDFAYVASHDLKEPLRGIHNYAGFLIEDYEAQLDDAGRERLETLMRLTRRMESLIDTLLHFSRVGRVDLAIEPVDLQRVVADIIDSLTPMLDGDGRVEIAEPLPTVRADRARIDEVFRNLIVNGIKYNDRTQKLVVVGVLPPGTSAGGVEPTEDEGPIFYVRDNGIGIPERHRQVVFDMFKRLHGRDAYGGGTGAGLAIAKKVVERHGGRIWLDSAVGLSTIEVGQGTTFFFTLRAPGEASHGG